MTLISADQLELLFMKLPEDRQTPGKLWCVQQKYDQAWHDRQFEDLGIYSFGVVFTDTENEGWTLRIDGCIVSVNNVQAMIHDLPVADDIPADSYETTCSHTVASQRGYVRRSVMTVLQWEKAIFTDPNGKEYVDWAINQEGII